MQDQFNTPVFTIWAQGKYAALGCTCSCGRRNVVMLWRDISKRQMGFNTPKEIQKKLRCKNCGTTPVDVVMVTYDQLPDWLFSEKNIVTMD